MELNFEIDKIVDYLNTYKEDLPNLYNWNAKIEKLIGLDTLNENQIRDLNKLSPFYKEIELKRIVGDKLKVTKDKNSELFFKISLWIIKEWGGIKSSNDKKTINLIKDFFNNPKPSFERIASTSKVGAYLNPEENIIYDSRVAYSLNWIILSQNAGKVFFPIPLGRNSKMSALDINVLIRLNNISIYDPVDIKNLDNRLFIKNSDKKIFINKKNAYYEITKLVKRISKDLWEGDEEKQKNLYYTEMLLFSIADKEIFMDIVSKYKI